MSRKRNIMIIGKKRTNTIERVSLSDKLKVFHLLFDFKFLEKEKTFIISKYKNPKDSLLPEKDRVRNELIRVIVPAGKEVFINDNLQLNRFSKKNIVINNDKVEGFFNYLKYTYDIEFKIRNYSKHEESGVYNSFYKKVGDIIYQLVIRIDDNSECKITNNYFIRSIKLYKKDLSIEGATFEEVEFNTIYKFFYLLKQIGLEIYFTNSEQEANKRLLIELEIRKRVRCKKSATHYESLSKEEMHTLKYYGYKRFDITHKEELNISRYYIEEYHKLK